MHYGAELAADTDAVMALLCLMTGDDAPAANGSAPHDQQAAAVLVGALQNNPAALGAVARAWPDLAHHTCPGACAPLGETLSASVVPARSAVAGEPLQHAAARVRAKVSALSGLLRDAGVRARCRLLGRRPAPRRPARARQLPRRGHGRRPRRVAARPAPERRAVPRRRRPR